MQILRNEKQKDNLAKFFWDDAKIALAALVVGPLTRPETVQLWVIGAGALATLAFIVLDTFLTGWRSNHESSGRRIFGHARDRCRWLPYSLLGQGIKVEWKIGTERITLVSALPLDSPEDAGL
jgi:hypothetical protein